ncbi:MAG: NADH-quinone oxidoreductase subunit A [Thaumarchaeota archaeon]|nr:NADH-quinone oxidoreductase subunit A [Candidatus Calditenuaceae archaeon]MDW8187459.1 NADH-quinone oxidoreductase subunit A [Nitrososphaerota archaeon]
MAAPIEQLWFLWDPFVLYVILVLLAPDIFYLVSWLIAPRRPSRVKKTAFESGQAPIRSALGSFPVEYFPYVIIYVAYAVIAILIFVSLVAVAEAGVTPSLLLLLTLATIASFYASSQLKEIVGRRG